MKCDVVIIGGSLAGAACARELVKSGVDAVALERDRFPRQKVCGGFLSPGAVDSLESLGVLDDVRGAGRFKSHRRASGLVRPMWKFSLKGRASGYRVPHLIMYSLAMRRCCREGRLEEYVRCAQDSSSMTSSAPL